MIKQSLQEQIEHFEENIYKLIELQESIETIVKSIDSNYIQLNTKLTEFKTIKYITTEFDEVTTVFNKILNDKSIMNKEINHMKTNLYNLRVHEQKIFELIKTITAF